MLMRTCLPELVVGTGGGQGSVEKNRSVYTEGVPLLCESTSLGRDFLLCLSLSIFLYLLILCRSFVYVLCNMISVEGPGKDVQSPI